MRIGFVSWVTWEAKTNCSQCGFNDIARVGGGKVVPASVDGLQQGLMQMLGGAGNLESMGDNLRQLVLDNFLWESIVGKYLTLFAKVLEDK